MSSHQALDANNEVGKAFGVVYIFPEDVKNSHLQDEHSRRP
jgi:hypothetical protein